MEQNTSFCARYGSFLVIPLKYDADSFDEARLQPSLTPVPMATMDLNENVKSMLAADSETAAGRCYAVSARTLAGALCPHGPAGFLVTDASGRYPFSLHDSYLYVFQTRVAFLCLSLSFDGIETLSAICNPGWAFNHAVFRWLDAGGEEHPFSVERWLGGVFIAAWAAQIF